jgi:glycosyltransferase involved in cell wall biosynthesis
MPQQNSALCILITNALLKNWSGSELYVSDVAVELLKRGHKPVVYSPRLGKLAEVLARKSVPVVDNLEAIDFQPDIIHAQHHLETMTALARFPHTPAVFFCHGWIPWEEIPPLHPRILQYVTVSDALRDRLIYQFGIPPEKTRTILNSVDLERFSARAPLPDVPKRALVFNSQVAEKNVLGIFQSVCARNGLELDVVGYGSQFPSYAPEIELRKSDIVFAVGRSALESLAVGCAVVCCGVDGVAQMVTTENLENLRRNNFGIRVLNRPLTEDILAEEIQRYNPEVALKVSHAVRAAAGLNEMTDQLMAVYQAVLNDYSCKKTDDCDSETRAFSVYLKSISDAYYQLAESHDGISQRIYSLERSADKKIRGLQAEIDQIRGSFTWRLYQRLVAVPLLRGLYMRLSAPFKKRHSRE